MSIPLILAAVLISGSEPDCLMAARAQYKEATAAFKASDTDRARKLYREAIMAFTELEAWPDLLRSYHAYLFVVPHSEEHDTFTRGLDLARRLGSELFEGQILHAHADKVFGRGDYAQSAEILETAIVLLERSDGSMYLADALTSLGRLHRAHGRPDLALPIYDRALRIQEGLGADLAAIQTINAIGIAYLHLDQPEKALEQSELGLRKALETNSARHINFMRGSVAAAHISLQQYEKAIPLLQQVLAEPITPYLAAYRNLSLAQAYLGLGRYTEAIDAADKAIELSKAAGVGVEPKLPALFARARAKARLGRQAEAMADVEESLLSIENIQARLVPEDFMKRGFIDTYQTVFGLAIELQSDRGAHAEALQTAEQARARSFLDLLATRQIDPSPLVMRSSSSQPVLPSFVSAEALSGEEIAVTARDLRSTLLIYWVNEDKTFIWVVDPDGTIHGRTVRIRAQRLASLVRQSWEQTASTPTRGLLLRGGETMTIARMERTAWAELYRHLILPVRDLLPSQRGSLLTVIPHGPLFRLSFAGLLDEKDRYLVESYAIHSAPAVSVLRFIASRTDDRDADGYLLLSNPRFGAPPDTKALPALPGSEREVKSIARLLSNETRTILNGGNASEKELRKSIEGKAVLHFATHGIVRDDQTLDSFLALAAGDGDKSNDGRLTAEEIYTLNLDADLVVLSACRSALGKVSGDGVAGFTRAFFYAGAASVVATLGDVADEPTSSLLRDFYQALRNGWSKSRALRSAQLAMLRRLRAGEVTVQTMAGPATLPEHPIFWASFVLQGRP